MTLANDVPSDLPRFFSFFRAPETKAELALSRAKNPAGLGEADKSADDDTTSDFVWALAYWPWL